MPLSQQEQEELRVLRAGSGEKPASSGLTPEEQQELSLLRQDAPAADDSGDGVVGGLISSGWQGATFGWGDKIESGLRAALLGEDYATALKKERADTEKFREQHPAMAIGAEVAGSIAPTALAAILSGGTGGAAAATSTAARLAALGGTAALGGASYGAGESEGEMFSAEQSADAIRGAAMGILTAGALKTAGSSFKKIANNNTVRKFLKKNMPTMQGLEQTKKALYNEVDTSPMRMTEKTTDRAIKNAKLEALAEKRGFDPSTHKKTMAFLDSLPRRLGANPSVSKIEAVRKQAYDELMDGTNDRFAYAIRQSLDDTVGGMKPTDVQFNPIQSGRRAQMGGPVSEANKLGASYPAAGKETGADVLKKLHSARAIHVQQLKLDKIEKLLASADVANAVKQGSNIGPTIKAKFNQLLQQEMRHVDPLTGNSKLFSKGEIDEISKLISGSLGHRALQGVGKFSPTSTRGMIVQAILHGGFNPVTSTIAVAGGAGAAGARALAGRQTKRAADKIKYKAGTGADALPIPATSADQLNPLYGAPAGALGAGLMDY
jgi:hypothetical protein